MGMGISLAAKQAAKRLAELGWNQTDLAKRMGKLGVHVAEGLVSRWLSGKRTPDRERSAAIQELLGVDPRLWTRAKKKRAA